VRKPGKLSIVLAGATAGVLILSGCSGAGSTGGGGGGGDNTITALMVGNPQMVDIQKLTADNFTKQTGITVKFTILPENELRDKVTQDVANQGGQYDVATIGAYEAPIWAKNNWLHELSTQASADANYDMADLLKPMVQSLSGEDGKLYAAPFYGESSFLMYNKDMFKAAGLTMPDKPTWDQVAQFAAKLDNKSKGVAGICLRGLPGWGEVMAPLTTVVNTYGGTWFEKDWTPKVNAPEFKAAANFYVNLIRQHGESGAPQAGFTECLNTFGQGKAAMWYDATSAAGTLEDPAAEQQHGGRRVGGEPGRCVQRGGDHGERPVGGQRLGDQLRREALVDEDGFRVAEKRDRRGRDPAFLRDPASGTNREVGFEFGGLYRVCTPVRTAEQTVLFQQA
jgi:sorbitol/mannitol transport system substrate-binding protein